jgi:phage terminase large subunit-like protein
MKLETSDTGRPRVRLYKPQLSFYESTATFRGFVGGRGAGKTFVGAFDLLGRLKPGRTYLVACPTAVLLQDTTFPTFMRLARHAKAVKQVTVSPYPTVTIGGGVEVRFRSADDPEMMRGANLSGAWLDEASLMSEAAYLVTIASLREGKELGWLSATFTPKGVTHWTYKTFATGQADTAIFRAKTADNPYVAPAFVGALARQYGPSRYARQEMDGEFVAVAGAEWPGEYFDGMLVPSLPDDLRLRVGWYDGAGAGDPRKGDYHALVLLGVSPDGTLWFDADLWHGTASEACARIDRVARPFAPAVIGVEMNFGHGFVMEHYAMWLQLQNRQRPGWPRFPLPFLGFTVSDPKSDRIRRIDPYLSRGQVRVRDTPGGRLLVDQWRDWPHAEHDDGPDAAAGAITLAAWVAAGRVF